MKTVNQIRDEILGDLDNLILNVQAGRIQEKHIVNHLRELTIKYSGPIDMGYYSHEAHGTDPITEYINSGGEIF